jgi:hypothetical protein
MIRSLDENLIGARFVKSDDIAVLKIEVVDKRNTPPFQRTLFALDRDAMTVKPLQQWRGEESQ